jgi:hypothetical protein
MYCILMTSQKWSPAFPSMAHDLCVCSLLHQSIHLQRHRSNPLYTLHSKAISHTRHFEILKKLPSSLIKCTHHLTSSIQQILFILLCRGRQESPDPYFVLRSSYNPLVSAGSKLLQGDNGRMDTPKFVLQDLSNTMGISILLSKSPIHIYY